MPHLENSYEREPHRKARATYEDLEVAGAAPGPYGSHSLPQHPKIIPKDSNVVPGVKEEPTTPANLPATTVPNGQIIAPITIPKNFN